MAEHVLEAMADEAMDTVRSMRESIAEAQRIDRMLVHACFTLRLDGRSDTATMRKWDSLYACILRNRDMLRSMRADLATWQSIADMKYDTRLGVAKHS